MALKNDPWGSALAGVFRSFNPAFYSAWRQGERRDMEQREQQRLDDEQNEQMRLVSEVLDPGKNITNPISGETTRMPPKLDMNTGQYTDRPKSGADDLEQLLQLTPANRNFIMNYRESLQPEEPKYGSKTFGNELLETKDGQVTGKVLKTKEKDAEEVWLEDEFKGRKTRSVYGYKKDGETVVTRKSAWSNLYDKKENANGETEAGLSNITLKMFNDYYKKQQDTSAALESLKQGIGVEVADEEGNITVQYADGNNLVPQEVLSQQLDAHNRNYSNIVDNAMTSTATTWYKSTYNEEGKDESGNVVKEGKKNPHPEDYWNKLKEDYANDKLGNQTPGENQDDKLDLELLVEKFKAIYGFDPTTVYGF